MSYSTKVDLVIPRINDLCCINCRANPLEMRDPIIKSLFHCQILTCRLIIYSVKCCIASPSVQEIDDLVHVVISKKFFETGKLQEHLTNLKIEFSEPETVHPKIYQACLKYTATFKLAPFWNLVGKSFYLRGSTFLSLPKSIDAIEWNILYKDGKSKIELRPLKLSLSSFNLIHSKTLSPGMMTKFRLDEKIERIGLDFENIWVYVLPKLTKAKVMSVSKTLPESSPFKNYNDLRRHWKNMYSYRLPKTDKGLLYYEVIFSKNPHQQFSYPELCLFSALPSRLLCENKNEVASEFIKDLCSKVVSVCGEALQIGKMYDEPRTNDECSFFSGSELIKSSGTKITSSSRESLSSSALFTFKKTNPSNPCVNKSSQKTITMIENLKKNNLLSQRPMESFNNVKQKLSQFSRSIPKQLPKSHIKGLPSSYHNFEEVDDEIILGNDKPERFVDHLTDEELENVVSYYDLPSMWATTEEEFKNGNLNDALLREAENYVEVMEKRPLRRLLLNEEFNQPEYRKEENVPSDSAFLLKNLFTNPVLNPPKQDKSEDSHNDTVEPTLDPKLFNLPKIKKIEKVNYDLSNFKLNDPALDKNLAEQYEKMLADDLDVSQYDGQSMISTQFDPPSGLMGISKVPTQLQGNFNNYEKNEGRDQFESLGLSKFNTGNILKVNDNQDNFNINDQMDMNVRSTEISENFNERQPLSKSNQSLEKCSEKETFFSPILSGMKENNPNKLNFQNINQSFTHTPDESCKSKTNETPEEFKSKLITGILKKNGFDKYKKYVNQSPFYQSIIKEQESSFGKDSELVKYLKSDSPVSNSCQQNGKSESFNDFSDNISKLSWSGISKLSDESLKQVLKQKGQSDCFEDLNENKVYDHQFKPNLISPLKFAPSPILSKRAKKKIEKKCKLKIDESFDVNQMYNELKNSLSGFSTPKVDCKSLTNINKSLINTNNTDIARNMCSAPNISPMSKISSINNDDPITRELLEISHRIETCHEKKNLEDLNKSFDENNLSEKQSLLNSINMNYNKDISNLSSVINKNDDVIPEAAENFTSFNSPDIFESYEQQNSHSLLEKKQLECYDTPSNFEELKNSRNNLLKNNSTLISNADGNGEGPSGLMNSINEGQKENSDFFSVLSQSSNESGNNCDWND